MSNFGHRIRDRHDCQRAAASESKRPNLFHWIWDVDAHQRAAASEGTCPNLRHWVWDGHTYQAMAVFEGTMRRMVRCHGTACIESIVPDLSRSIWDLHVKQLVFGATGLLGTGTLDRGLHREHHLEQLRLKRLGNLRLKCLNKHISQHSSHVGQVVNHSGMWQLKKSKTCETFRSQNDTSLHFGTRDTSRDGPLISQLPWWASERIAS